MRNRFEVVADTRRAPTPAGEPTEFEDPSINIFSKQCELLWRQSYPELAEAGFKVLNPPGVPMLYVAAISVFRPVDQVLAEEELISDRGYSFTVELTSGNDRYDNSYVGPLGAAVFPAA